MFESEFAIAIGWQFLIKGNVKKIVVIHDSLLPKYRGFAPVVTALIRGERTLGATAFLATNTMDAGPIIAQRSINVEYPIKLWTVIEQLSDVYWQLVECIFTTVESGQALPQIVQDESQASYSIWRNEDDFAIDWNASAEEICRFIDATGFPYKGASTMMKRSVVRVMDAVVVPDLPFEIRQPGKIWAIEGNSPIIVCGQGMVKVLKTDPPLQSKRLRVRFT
jgi:methionyl-tRNA formyltransferase